MRDAPKMHEQCTATTKAGQRCRARALPSSQFCVSHDPAKVTQLAEWRRQGGFAKSSRARAKKALPADPMTAAELHSYLGVVFKGVIAGKIEPGVGTATATIAKTMVDIAREADLEQRITNLEHERSRRRTA